MSRRRYKVRLQPLFGKSVIAGAIVFDFLLPCCKSIHSMPIFAVFLYLLTEKANFRLMLAAEDYVDGVSRKLQPVIRNDDKRYAACRRIFLLRMRQAERKQSTETETCLAAFRRHIGKACGFWRGLFWLLCRFRSRIRRMAMCGTDAGVEAKCGQEGFCGVYFLSGAASGFFCTGFARNLPGIRCRRAVA